MNRNDEESASLLARLRDRSKDRPYPQTKLEAEAADLIERFVARDIAWRQKVIQQAKVNAKDRGKPTHGDKIQSARRQADSE